MKKSTNTRKINDVFLLFLLNFFKIINFEECKLQRINRYDQYEWTVLNEASGFQASNLKYICIYVYVCIYWDRIIWTVIMKNSIPSFKHLYLCSSETYTKY